MVRPFPPAMLYRLLEMGLNKELINSLRRQNDIVGYIEFFYYLAVSVACGKCLS